MDNLDNFMQKMLRPTYVYRMSQPGFGRSTEAQIKSAQTRNINAKKEIHELILEYVADEYPDAQLDG